MANGTYSLDARNTGITMSGPGWPSILTGVWPDKHGVIDNSFAKANFLRYPHFFKYKEEADPDNRTVSIVHWNPINDYLASKMADVTFNADSDGEVKNMAAT